jgi:hypothetical protein
MTAIRADLGIFADSTGALRAFCAGSESHCEPDGASKTPKPNHKQPLAPRLLATMAAQMPKRSQIMRNSIT